MRVQYHKHGFGARCQVEACRRTQSESGWLDGSISVKYGLSIHKQTTMNARESEGIVRKQLDSRSLYLSEHAASFLSCLDILLIEQQTILSSLHPVDGFNTDLPIHQQKASQQQK